MLDLLTKQHDWYKSRLDELLQRHHEMQRELDESANRIVETRGALQAMEELVKKAKEADNVNPPA